MRASEAANLKLTDIDWKNGQLAIAGKSRREEWLPLTQEMGDAIIAYVEQTRPRLPKPRLFFTDFAPIRPFTRVTVRCIVRRALSRAGIKSAHRGARFGILCGTGQGIMMAANKVRSIRCGVCVDTFSARMIRQHNDANMHSVGARVVGEEPAIDIVDTFLAAQFEGGRHATRVEMIGALER